MANSIILAGSAALVLLAIFSTVESALKDGECEVCIKFLDKFIETVTDDDRKDSEIVETKFRKFCKKTKGKDHRFCYYVGGVDEAATGILNHLTKPITYHLPASKICEKLKKMDSQICELAYEKTIDLTTVNLKKLKVKDLKKILDVWNEDCKGCAEKSDFIKRIEELMPTHDPEAAKKRREEL